MPSPADLPPQYAYAEYMHALRGCIRRVDKIISGHSPMKNEEWDTEVVCLMLRKSFEHVAFASLVAHREVYSAVFADFETHWSAKRLLQKLEKVHPDFYPSPVSIPVQQLGSVKHLPEVEDDFLTKDEFVLLYDVCSQVIHTRNPYKAGPWVIDTGRSLREWASHLKRLLHVHYIRLSAVPGVWLVQMVHPHDGKVHVFSCEPVKGPTGEL
jgi:hypothetical protein